MSQQDKATIVFIGRIRTPYKNISDCPYQGAYSNEICTIEVFSPYEEALKDIDSCSHLILLYWMNIAKREILIQKTPHDDKPHGVFATRSPNRPNPIGLSVVELKSCNGRFLQVKGIDCLDETPLIDIKPYSSKIDSYPEAVIGWLKKAGSKFL